MKQDPTTTQTKTEAKRLFDHPVIRVCLEIDGGVVYPEGRMGGGVRPVGSDQPTSRRYMGSGAATRAQPPIRQKTENTS